MKPKLRSPVLALVGACWLVCGSGCASDASPADTGSSVESGCPSQPLAAGDHTFQLASANGISYSYVLVVPTGLDATKKAPLVVVWHALQSSPEETRSLTDIDAQGQASGSLMVYPISPDKSWDAGSCCTSFALGQRRDETVFARELVADVKTKACVDDKRVVTTGFSNGGMVSQLLACTAADLFGAAAVMGSNLTMTNAATDCKPSRPIPIFMINGTADPLVGYDKPALAGGLSVPASFEHWAAADSCTDEPTVTFQQGAVTCKTHSQCAAGTEVTLCSVEGMGHCMPGMKKESETNCITKLIPLGMPNDDIDGVEMSTEWLQRFMLP
jgi:polyhydroxybutyrate depolymerase